MDDSLAVALREEVRQEVDAALKALADPGSGKPYSWALPWLEEAARDAARKAVTASMPWDLSRVREIAREEALGVAAASPVMESRVRALVRRELSNDEPRELTGKDMERVRQAAREEAARLLRDHQHQPPAPGGQDQDDLARQLYLQWCTGYWHQPPWPSLTELDRERWRTGPPCATAHWRAERHRMRRELGDARLRAELAALRATRPAAQGTATGEREEVTPGGR